MRLIFLLLLCAFAYPSHASSYDEFVLIDGKRYTLLSQSPLDKRFSGGKVLSIMNGNSPVPYLLPTDRPKEQFGTWKIEWGQLLLTEVYLPSDTKVPLAYLFPRQVPPIFADWFSGILELGEGEAKSCKPEEGRCLAFRAPLGVWYVRFESYLELDIKNGYLTSHKEFVPKFAPRTLQQR